MRARALKQRALPVQVVLPLQAAGLEFVPTGEFPRRVEIGEPVAHSGNFPMLAPSAGLLSRAGTASLVLQIEGRIKVAEASHSSALLESRPEEASQKLQALLEKCGLFSFADKEPLSQVLDKFSRRSNGLIFFSFVDLQGLVDWPRIMAECRVSLPDLEQVLLHIFPDARIKTIKGPNRFFSTQQEQIRQNLPQTTVMRIQGKYQAGLSLAQQGVLVLDPATLIALYECIFFGQPYVSTFHVDASGWRPQLYRLLAGFPLSERPEQYFNIYTAFANDLPAPTEKPGWCNGCLACDQICPVDARPLSLLETAETFRADRCFQCHLCSAACPAGIDLMAHHPGPGKKL